ncbi:MAG: FeoA family protein [Methylacidiphilales bacterium]|nr:FeoA family protein [Candidatus Methylacidiphilales bacterium]
MSAYLNTVPVGTQGVVFAIDDHHAHTKALRRLGVHEGAFVEVVSGIDPVILRCHQSKFAVRRESLAAVQIRIRRPGKATGKASSFVASNFHPSLPPTEE